MHTILIENTFEISFFITLLCANVNARMTLCRYTSYLLNNNCWL